MEIYTTHYPSTINWENAPSTSTPIDADNLGRGDSALYYIDHYLAQLGPEMNQIESDVLEHEEKINTINNTLANHESRITNNTNRSLTNQENILKSLKSLEYNENTGVFIFTWHNGLTKTIDLNIEKIPVSFSLSNDGILTMINTDGTRYTCDISAIIKNYNFIESSTIQPVIIKSDTLNKTVKFEILDGSITEEKLQPKYLADIKAQADRAEAAVLGTIIANFVINEDGDLIYTKYKQGEIILHDVNFAIINNDYLEVTING